MTRGIVCPNCERTVGSIYATIGEGQWRCHYCATDEDLGIKKGKPAVKQLDLS